MADQLPTADPHGDSNPGTSGMEGDLATFPLYDMMRWLYSSRRSVVMRVTTGDTPAWIFFKEGNLYRAEWAGRSGIEAIIALVGLRSGSFWLSKRPVSGGTRNVDMPTAELLRACGELVASSNDTASGIDGPVESNAA